MKKPVNYFNNMNSVNVPISIGELLDKITILQIKAEKTTNLHVHKELEDLTSIAININVYNEDHIKELKIVNNTLWIIEDRLRELEKLKQFDDEFIDLARKVYITNDMRAKIKRKINIETESEYFEVKLY